LSQRVEQAYEQAGRRGRIFSATFTKKDGTKRSGAFRLGVRKYVNGIGMSYNPSEKDLIVAFDMNKRGYRMLPLDDRIVSVKVNGKEFLNV